MDGLIDGSMDVAMDGGLRRAVDGDWWLERGESGRVGNGEGKERRKGKSGEAGLARARRELCWRERVWRVGQMARWMDPTMDWWMDGWIAVVAAVGCRGG